MACVSDETQIEIEAHDLAEDPVRYSSMERVYSVSSSSLCCTSAVGSHSLMSKKVKAQKLPMIEQFEVQGSRDCCVPDDCKLRIGRPEIARVYCRRRKRPRRELEVNAESVKLGDATDCSEEEKLNVDSSGLRSCTGLRLRECEDKQIGSSRKKGKSVKNQDKVSLASPSAMRWVRLSYDGVDPESFIGLQCKVFWPLDAFWYTGSIVGYSLERKRHTIKYEDGYDEDVVLDREMIKFFISREEMKLLHLKVCTSEVTVGRRDYDEMVVLAASLEDGKHIWPEGYTDSPFIFGIGSRKC